MSSHEHDVQRINHLYIVVNFIFSLLLINHVKGVIFWQIIAFREIWQKVII
uniref:Uncharacterized protein n=1 Tax=Rhizophora mucronata TaxID=61149 RepID=A0A2P2QG06_RHIMU